MSRKHSIQGGPPEAPLPGWPGYRTRSGRSGYDPLDTNRELGHMEGTFYRRLFTGQLRTRNPLYLVALGTMGFGLVLPLVCSLAETLDQRALSPSFICSVPLLLGSIFFLINFWANLRRRLPRRPPDRARGGGAEVPAGPDQAA